MPTITITDEELHEIVEVLNYRVLAYRHSVPPPSAQGSAWIDRYEEQINVTIKKLEGILDDPVNHCDPYHLKQIMSWNKCLDKLQSQNKKLETQVKDLKQFVTELAEDDCSYGDNCPTFGSRHGQCLSCKARKTLSLLTQQIV